MPEFYGARSEFEQLKALIKKQKLTSLNDVRNALEVYFKGIEWSLLKVEWERLKESERSSLVAKLLSDM